MSKNIKKVSLCLILFMTILIFSNMSYAKEDAEWILPEKTEQFKNWEKLSEEEKENTTMPALFSETLKNSIRRSEYNRILEEQKGTLEAKYQRPNITIKDQKQTNSCWAFAFSSTIEGSGKGRVYSPFYLNYVASEIYSRTIVNGGNYMLAMGASAAGRYPVLETKMPSDSIYNETTNSAKNDYLIPLEQLPAGTLNKKVDARITDATYLASIYKDFDTSGNITYSDGGGTNYTTDEVQALRTIIKEHVKSKGPICAGIYAETASYNNNTGAYCYKGEVVAGNHAVNIVGWDDNYAVSNFNSANRPKSPGAYIALNSGGEDSGKDGYLYISYEDALIESSLFGIESIEEYNNENEIPYDTIYQYDELGFTYTIGASREKVMAANVFSRNNSKVEYVNEVGLFIPVTTGVQVYVNGANEDKTKLGQVVAEVSCLEPGYHVVPLASPVKLTGSKFVVAVRYINKEKEGAVPLEINAIDSGIMSTPSFLDTAKGNAGESFVSLDEGANWEDINGLSIGDNITFKNTNVCIKAYTTTSDEPVTKPVTGVNLDKTTIKIEVGETETLKATIAPNDATNKNITWTSSDENVATVANGVVTGKAKGTATIKVTTQDGNHVAECKVTVEESEEEPIVVDVTGVKLDKEEATVKVSKTITLEATVLPENATNKNVKWTSSNERIATVENGVVTGIKEGTATITVTTVEGEYTASCEVEVTQIIYETPTIDVTGVTLNKKSMALEVGDTANLVASIEPRDATEKQVKWESSNEKVATISETGIIKAISEGKTTIKVTTIDGEFSATCELTVSKKQNSADDIYKDSYTSSNGSNSTTIKGDNTVAKTTIPYAGNNTILLIAIVLGAITMVVIFIKVKKLKDVK